jgi:hypothetical protein
MKPWYLGLDASGTRGTMMTMAPAETPADPAPAMVRPRMKAIELGAAPQRAEPISKSAMAKRKTVLVGKNENSRPKRSCVAQPARTYALPYQPMSSIEWNSSVIFGIAVAMIILS